MFRLTVFLLLGLLVPFGASPQVPDPVYATPWVRSLVEGAAARRRSEVERSAPSTYVVESEIAVLVHRATGEQIVTGVEQVSGRVSWSGAGSLVQSVTGYRSRFAGPALSLLTYIQGPWVVAPLVGDRIPIALASDRALGTRGQGGSTAAPAWEGTDASGRRRALPSMVNPLGSERDEYYRFAGGDTVLILTLPARAIPVVRVEVEPRSSSPEFRLFRGEIHLDALEHQVVRVRGEVLAPARARGALRQLMRATLEPHFLLDLENALGEGGVWLPHRQWLELEARSPLTDEVAAVRIVTDFSAPTPDSAGFPEADTARALTRRALLRLGMDVAGGKSGWHTELGALTAERNPMDFADLRQRGAAGGVRFGTRTFSQAVRYDRVEGLFTGGGVKVGSGTAGSGVYAALHGGWAWSESTVRGGLEVGVTGSGWEVAAGAARSLASTNDFPRPFVTGATLFGVLDADDLDYVDRYWAGVRVLHLRRGVALRGEVGGVRDRAAVQHVQRSPLGVSFPPVRTVAQGDYARVAVALALREGRGGEFLTPGWSAGISGEAARGDLAWLRVEGSVRARRQLGRWSGAWEAFAGWVASEAPPPQALFELGGWTSRLPGYPVKAFTGDRAGVGMAEVAYTLPLLEAPLRIRSLLLPPPAPSPLAQVSAGWTGASPNAVPVLSAHGWEVSAGARATLFLGIRLFGGFARVGAARPLGVDGSWRFEVGMSG